MAGMVYNGFDFGPYLRVNPHRSIVPPVTVECDEVPGGRGERFRSARLGKLTITVDAELRVARGKTVEELRHMLASKLYSASPAPLSLPDDPHRYHLAVLSGESELDTLWETGEAQLTFVAPDPASYGMGGACALDRAASVRPGGTVETAPTIRVVPEAGDGYTVTHAQSGMHVEVRMPFDGATELVIDCAAAHCEAGGTSADEWVTMASDYFTLAPGEANDLEATGGAGIVSWVERWL